MDLDAEFKALMKLTGGVLREHGFKGSGQNYKRDLKDQWQAINIQKSKTRATKADAIKFTINISVYFPLAQPDKVYADWLTYQKFTWTESDAVRFRVADFMSTEQDVWWSLDSRGIDRLWPDFERVLREVVIAAMQMLEGRTSAKAFFDARPGWVNRIARAWLEMHRD